MMLFLRNGPRDAERRRMTSERGGAGTLNDRPEPAVKNRFMQGNTAVQRSFKKPSQGKRMRKCGAPKEERDIGIPSASDETLIKAKAKERKLLITRQVRGRLGSFRL